MCTGFVKRGGDLVVGYNLDLAEGAWDYKVYARNDMFYIGIKVGSTIYKTHGVNKNGNFGNLPYMNGPVGDVLHRGAKYQRIDLLVNDYISARLDYDDLLSAAKTKEMVNVPGASMHSLFFDAEGRILLVEPGLGFREIHDDFAVISNFPLLGKLEDPPPVWYGIERYDRGVELLRETGDDFSAADGMALLQQLTQTGQWATRVSFVYSKNENAVYYVRNNDFGNVMKHSFK